MKLRCMRLLLALACVFSSALIYAETIEKGTNTATKSKLAIYNTTDKSGEYVRKNVTTKPSDEDRPNDSYSRKRSPSQGNYKAQSVPITLSPKESTPVNKVVVKSEPILVRDTIIIYQRIESQKENNIRVRNTGKVTEDEDQNTEQTAEHTTTVNSSKQAQNAELRTSTDNKKPEKEKTLPKSLFQQNSEK